MRWPRWPTCCVVAVPDDVLPDLAHGLAASGALRAGTMVAHTSGAHGADVLEPLTRVGALPMALHPVMTFTGTEVDLQRLAGACFGVTAPDALRLAAEALVIEMGAEPVWIEEAARPLYHAALAVGANHLVTLVAQSADMLRRQAWSSPRACLARCCGAGSTTRFAAATLPSPDRWRVVTPAPCGRTSPPSTPPKALRRTSRCRG